MNGIAKRLPLLAVYTLLSDAHTVRLDDPQAILSRLTIHQDKRTLDDCDYVLNALCLRAKNPDAVMRRRWIASNVREIEIKGDKNPNLFHAGVEDAVIGTAVKLFVVNGMRIMARANQ